jgi:hypothetical protein
MKFLIAGKEYDAEAGVSKVSLATLYELKVRTGIGMKGIMAAAKKISEFTDPMDLLEDKDAFQAFRVIIWLARKHAGEKNITLDDATNFPLDSLMLVIEDDDDDTEAVDPKAPPASGPAESTGTTTPST